MELNATEMPSNATTTQTVEATEVAVSISLFNNGYLEL